MFTSLYKWLDQRAGLNNFIGALLLENVPGGPRWRYVWGSVLAFVFSIQVVTGIMLMTAYSPSASQAWSSVHAIQYKMDFGWLIRGLHHFGSQTMMVLIALHMLQVVIAGAHLPPREINWWLGIGLLSITLGLSLTGYLLPWDQKGYWATTVATNIAGTLPGLGDELKPQAVGGPDYGNYTLTRFYALHVGVLPLILVAMLFAHIGIFRRHGVTSAANEEGLVNKPENEHAKGTEPFWPRQAFYDMIGCMVVFGIMFGAVLYGFAHEVTPPPKPDGQEPTFYENIARAGVHGKGAELDAAADRDTSNYPARPEWYFLFLFQLLKYFPGEHAIWGTVIIPNGAMVILVVLPLLGYGPLRKFGHFVGLLFLVVLFVMVGLLTLKAFDDDSPEGILWGIMKTGDEETRQKEKEKAEKFQRDVEDAHAKAKRACQLAMDGTPVEGGHVLMRNDPLTAGRVLFEQRCGTCHAFTAREDDPFRRVLPLEHKYEQAFPDNFPLMRDALKKKGVALAEKFTVKEVEPGQWRIDEEEIGRTIFVARKRGNLELSTRSLTDGLSASDLGDFASKAWIRGLLENPVDHKFFGLIKKEKVDDQGNVIKENGKAVMVHALTGMKTWRYGINNKREDWDKEAKAKQDADFDAIADWLVEIRKRKDDPIKAKRPDDAIMKKGEKAFSLKVNRCNSCHGFDVEVKDEKTKEVTIERAGANIGEAPDLTDYGSEEWIRSMIMRPMHARHYGDKNFRMPAFRNKEGDGAAFSLREFRETTPNAKDKDIQQLTDVERELIIRWMLRDYRPIYGGAPIK